MAAIEIGQVGAVPMELGLAAQQTAPINVRELLESTLVSDLKDLSVFTYLCAWLG